MCANWLSTISDVQAVDSDTTLFSLANANYQQVIELLLRATTCAGLTEANLIAFKTQFGATAFVCPVKGCVSRFCSETELNDHKTRRHKQRLRCYQGHCTRNDVGFASMASLRQHVKRVHTKETPRIPKALKRRKMIEDHEPPVPSGSYTTDTYPSDEPEVTPLDDLEVDRLRPEYKKGPGLDDWLVVFNPTVPRLLDLDLVHTLAHGSVVCSVKFSMDGKFVATGCNKSAQIYDAISGEEICVLQDDDANHGGDNYIKALCFSPDGKYLATASEDTLVRVRTRAVTTPAASLLTSTRSGTSLPVPLGTPLMAMTRSSIV